MRDIGTSTSARKLAGVGLLAALTTATVIPVANGVARQQPDRVRPQVTLRCDVESCVVEATYVLTTRRDGHAVAVRWQTVPFEQYGENRGDVLEHDLLAGIGSGAEDAVGYRYTVSDLVWHSDIRCDRGVLVEVSIDGESSGSTSVWKPVPGEPNSAYCTDYGMPGETD